jgi:hypothetical protein
MEPNKKYSVLASDESIGRAVAALQANGINAMVVENGDEAKKKLLEMIPQGAEVMTMTSVTLDSIGASKEINESGKYDSVRKKFATMDKSKQASEMQKLGAAPDWTAGSVHAVTEDGKIIVCSQTGSQLAAYAYGSQHVIWAVGAQKIVPNLEEAMKRVSEYTLPLENERAQKAYGKGSAINKMLIIHKEVNPSRLNMIIIKENIGF